MWAAVFTYDVMGTTTHPVSNTGHLLKCWLPLPVVSVTNIKTEGLTLVDQNFFFFPYLQLVA